MKIFLLFNLLVSLLGYRFALAELEPVECVVRICTQNMYNFASYERARLRFGELSKIDWLTQHASVLKRFIDSNCDLIALQEVLKESGLSARQNLFRFMLTLKYFTGKNFSFIISNSKDPSSDLAFLYRNDLFTLLEKSDLSILELPKFSRAERPQLNSRGPLRAIFKSKCNRSLYLDLYNLHFKSSSTRGGFDPSGYGFEIQRTLQAEFLRNYASKEFQDLYLKLNKEAALISILLGDRNADYNAASAQVLAGQISLADFHEGNCTLSKSKKTYCSFQKNNSGFISVFGGPNQQYSNEGTFKYGNKQLWLDDILVYAASNWGSWSKSLQLLSGRNSSEPEASDHSLLYLQIAW